MSNAIAENVENYSLPNMDWLSVVVLSVNLTEIHKHQGNYRTNGYERRQQEIP